MDQGEIYRLRIENERLKTLLQRNGISYEPQNNAIIDDDRITREKVMLFFKLFKGRTDVFAKRSGYPDRKTGRIGYYPQIDWSSKAVRKYLPLTATAIYEHLLGQKADCSDVIGVYPLMPDGKCNFLVFDFDSHQAEASDQIPEKVKFEVDLLRQICQVNGVECYTERSRSGNGAHVWLFFDEPIEAGLARDFATSLLNKGSENVSLPTFETYDRMIPAQDQLPINRKTGKVGIGNMIALPLQGRALKLGNSAFVDENWQVLPDQWAVLRAVKRISKNFIEEKMTCWAQHESLDSSKQGFPWEVQKEKFRTEDVIGKVEMVISNQIYIKKSNLRPRFQNELRRTAAFSNPEFYRKYNLGFSTYNTPRIIYCGYDDEDYICLPRGLRDDIMNELKNGNMKFSETDLRENGKKIKVSFKGALYPEQEKAVRDLTEFDNGILSAATAFGKTVVGANIISIKKVSTLILVPNTELLRNWQADLEKFLRISEKPPLYMTPSGRKKLRASVIGTIKSGNDKSTGIVDIAMISSIKEIEPNKYGLVLMDERHHGPARTSDEVLRKIKAKYLYGLTATPKRKDGLDKKLLMEFGGIRHNYSARDRLEKTNLKCWVSAKNTDFVSTKEKLTISELYLELTSDQDRNDAIVADILDLAEKKRSILVLSRFKSQSNYIFESLRDKINNVFLMTGDIKLNDRDTIWKSLQNTPPNAPLVLVSTMQLIGEGFNLPRLDALVLATPISWSGNLEQCVGRLHRDYPEKEEVVVYDYVDADIPIFNRMFKKRLTTYRKIGYTVK